MRIIAARCHTCSPADTQDLPSRARASRRARKPVAFALGVPTSPWRLLHAHHLPSAPEQPVLYIDETNRPQPRLDVMNGQGMSTSVGRLRPCPLLDGKFVLLSHNTLRGAAGAAVLNAEVLAKLNRLPGNVLHTQSGSGRQELAHA